MGGHIHDRTWVDTYRQDMGGHIYKRRIWAGTYTQDTTGHTHIRRIQVNIHTGNGGADTQQKHLMETALSEDLKDVLIVDITLKLFLPLPNI
jgi:hypothetical protein